MANATLIEYITKELEKGVSRDLVRKALLDVGWDDALVDEHFRIVEKGEDAVPPAPTPAAPAGDVVVKNDEKPRLTPVENAGWGNKAGTPTGGAQTTTQRMDGVSPKGPSLHKAALAAGIVHDEHQSTMSTESDHAFHSMKHPEDAAERGYAAGASKAASTSSLNASIQGFKTGDIPQRKKRSIVKTIVEWLFLLVLLLAVAGGLFYYFSTGGNISGINFLLDYIR